MPDSPLTGDVVICSDEFNSAPANSVHLATTGGANAVWKSFANDAAVTPPFNEYSLSLDGSNEQYLTSAPVTPTAQQGTISAWIKTTTSSFSTIFAWSNNLLHPTVGGTTRPMLSLNTGKLDFLYQQQDSGSHVNRVTSTSTVNDGAWHHVAVTSNGSSWTLYIDGSSASYTTPLGTNTGQWVGDIYSIDPSFVAYSDIGAARRGSNIGGSAYATMSIDEVAVWDSALSGSDIASLIDSSGANPVPANISSLNPSAWWRMGDASNDTAVDGGSVASITDSSGNGYTATQATAANQPTFSVDTPS